MPQCGRKLPRSELNDYRIRAGSEPERAYDPNSTDFAGRSAAICPWPVSRGSAEAESFNWTSRAGSRRTDD
jgi:hypothetical protein